MSENDKSTENDGKGTEIDTESAVNVSSENVPIRVIVSTPETDKFRKRGLAQIQKVIEAKETKIIQARQDVIESGTLNELDLKVILNKEDQEFYQEKKKSYIDAYPDLGSDPFDMDDLHDMIIEQIIQRSLLRKKRIRPTADIDKAFAESKKRQSEAKRSLSMRRTDRLKNKGETKKVLNIASLSINFSDKDKMQAMLDRVQSMRLEESILEKDEKVVE